MRLVFLHQLPLAPRTTLGIGGAARFFTEPTTLQQTQAALAAAAARGLSVFVLGGGSNLVIADAGWPGLVIKPSLTHYLAENLAENLAGKTELTVGAGLDWNVFVDRCVAQGLGGVECLAGIPGSVGATPIQNVGAYGQQVADTIHAVTALDRQSLAPRVFANPECHFGYRQSRFNTDETGRWLVLEVSFRLAKGAAAALKYRDLGEHFGPAATPTLAEVAAAVRQIRAKKGMVVDPADRDSRSAGSFFKNPLVRAAQVPAAAPRWVQPDGTVKVPAAWLIEHAGLVRGQTLAGGIGISGKHALALVNQSGGTASEVVVAARLVQERVDKTWGIMLHPEPIFVGFSPTEVLPEGAIRIDA